MSSLRVFIGHDSRFPEPSRVLAYSLRKHSSVALSIQFLDLEHLRCCYDWERRVHDPRASTQFTYSRFLAPWLCGYEGRALVVDNDILCLDDVAPLAEIDMAGLALRVVQHDYRPVETTKMHGIAQTSYHRKNWSSVMLMDCGRLRCWTPEAVATASGVRLHQFQDVPDAQIGELRHFWNELDHWESGTRLLHWTSGMLWNDATKAWPHQELWLAYRREWLRSLGRPEDTPLPSLIGGA